MTTQRIINLAAGARHGIWAIAEIVLAALILAAVGYFSFSASGSFLSRDWSSMSVMYEFISFILLVLLGLEVARLILVHSISVVMELMLLIIARKMLYPEIAALDLLFCTMAFALVVAIYYFYELKPIKSLEDLTR